MTDKEIIKALECCADIYYCTDCPCKEFCNDLGKLQKNALNLINRQQAEIERLTTLSELGKMRANDYRVMRDRALKAEAEIERLQIRLRKVRNQFTDLGKMYSEIRAEAIKEFAERLKEKIELNFSIVDVYDCINNLAEEMVGEDK